VVGAVDVDVEETVAGLRAKANAVKIAALANQPIAERVAPFCFPSDRFTWSVMFCPDVVKAVGEQREKLVIPLRHIVEGFR